MLSCTVYRYHATQDSQAGIATKRQYHLSAEKQNEMNKQKQLDHFDLRAGPAVSMRFLSVLLVWPHAALEEVQHNLQL